MILKPEMIRKQEEIGRAKGIPVYRILSTGGLELIVKPDVGVIETLAVAPHIGLAKYIAQKKCPDIIWTSLEKNFTYDLPRLEAQSPQWELVTDLVNQTVPLIKSEE